MHFKRILYSAVLIVLVSVFWVSAGQAQDATPEPSATPINTQTPLVITRFPVLVTLPPFIITPVPADDVAVIIVDVFEENPLNTPIDQKTLTVDPATGNPTTDDRCVISTTPLDGLAYRGNVTSRVFALKHQHGNMVFQQLRNVIINEYMPNTNNAQPTPIQSIPMTNAPNAELWATPFGNVWLAGVDTQEYNISLIATRVDAAIAMLHTNHGVNHFVVNMSFGLAPCTAIPSVTVEDYKKQLKNLGINEPFDNSPLGQLASAFAKFKFNQNDPISELNQIIQIRDAYPEAFALVHILVMQPKIQAALTPSVDPTNLGNDLQNFDYFTNPDPNVTIVRVASAGNDGLSYPYYPAANKNVLSVAAAYAPYSNNYISNCRPGTHFDIYAYFLSKGYSAFAADKFIHYIYAPLSNAGEVIDNGLSTLNPEYYLKDYTPSADVLGCLTGTSFAAPNVALKLAFDQATRNNTTCMDAGVRKSDPPFAHSKWNNLSITNAIIQYCPDFRLVP